VQRRVNIRRCVVRANSRPIRQRDYAALAGFRSALRRFLAFSETAAREVGLGPRQYQALLAIRAFPGGQPAVGELATELAVRHHSAVGLVDRLAALGLIERVPDRSDRRRVCLRLTRRGARRLEELAAVHREQLRQLRPQLAALLRVLARPPRRRGGRRVIS
jgi:DNA-binding MarR family transcriptional regulator